MPHPLADISPPLLRWYRRRRRDLPWRRTRNPYAIWISEVMLQQTRVETVIPYYERFLERFPDASSLARADEEEVLRHWAGLGYYSRGRNLHAAARRIREEHGGRFPREPESIRELPGVGEYTAAAVGSIAFGEASPVVDGNVERVFSRLLALEGDPRQGAAREAVHAAALAALDRDAPGDHNQALMELGATVCTPRNPRCTECPVGGFCRARDRGDPERFPPPRRKRAPEEQHWIAVVAHRGEDVLLSPPDPEAELLRDHWGLPLRRWPGDRAPTEPQAAAGARELLRQAFRRTSRGGRLGPVIRHGITYRRLRIHPVLFPLRTIPSGRGRLCPPGERRRLAALHRKILDGVSDGLSR